MIRKQLSIFLAVALMSVLFLCGCGKPVVEETPIPPNRSTDPSTQITLTDPMGNTVTLDKPAQRVVVLTASACEIVYALDAGDTVVGRGEYCDWPAEVLDIAAVASGAETNIEQIIALQPDLVLMAAMDQTPEQVEQIQKAGIAVYSSNAKNIDETYGSILDIGVLMGKETEAQKIVDDMKATFDSLAQNKLSGTVYFEVSPLEFGLWAAGNGTFMNEIAELIGLDNVFADVSSFAEISEEQVFDRNPEYILTIGMYFGEGLTPDDEIKARTSWDNVSAVEGNRILNLPNNELSRPGPRLAQGAQALYDFVKANPVE